MAVSYLRGQRPGSHAATHDNSPGQREGGAPAGQNSATAQCRIRAGVRAGDGGVT